MDQVGERVRLLRKERRWTQAALAEKLNVSPQVVSNWERRYTDPDHDDLARLAEVFDVSADYVLGRSKDRKSQSDKLITNDQAMNDVIKAYNRLPQRKKKIVDDVIRELLGEDS